MSSLSNLVRHSTDIRDTDHEETTSLTVEAHRRVLRSVSGGNRGGAFAAMGRHRHGVHAALEGGPPDGYVTVDGREAPRSTDDTA